MIQATALNVAPSGHSVGSGLPWPMSGLGPFLRWAGGKQRLVTELTRYLPPDAGEALYVEPFLGAGSLFFRVMPRHAILSDLNTDLIKCYRYLRANPRRVAKHLHGYARRDADTYYYGVRSRYNNSKWGPGKAARFIYLNRTCFNGIYRVNHAGDFNVPYGHKAEPTFPGTTECVELAAALRRAKLRAKCFRGVLAMVPAGSFVYLDPPYPPLTETAFFTHYTTDRFGTADHMALAKAVRSLDKRGIRFLMSNADTPLIRGLYRPFEIERLNVTRSITAGGSKLKVRELVIRNY